jgi:hypothetical protein
VIHAQHTKATVGEAERERETDAAEADHRDGAFVGHRRLKRNRTGGVSTGSA